MTSTEHLTNDERVTTAEAAEILGERRRTVLRMVDRGDLMPARKLVGARGTYMFNRSDVEQLAAERAR